MSINQELPHTATTSESATAKRETPRIFLALMVAMVVFAVIIMVLGAKFISH